ncbi:N-glycosylase/DNA lyase [Candidatus Bathyarchaeota archaeon]|nr:N-glycosylase/DNA lyase [Candidatus Bathyarchaeota archaeon]
MKENLIKKIISLKQTEIKQLVEKRVKEFKDFYLKPNEEWFSELCFCILTANSSAELGIKIQKEIKAEGFLTLSKEELALKLKAFGHRFYFKRAEFIVEARKYKNIKDLILSFSNIKACREWLVKNIKGLWFKEASHFLRNVGYFNFAILDRHILKILKEYYLISFIPKTLTKRKYLEIENILKKLADETELTLGELDLYLWFMETGKILK